MKRRAADLFCGAGGTSHGFIRACQDLSLDPDLLAINHWPTAIATHKLNHSGVRHLCETLDKINPRDVIPGRHLHLLAASPECTHHSNAAGGRPRNEQSRAGAWQVCRWVQDIHVDTLLIENVREFMNWGPLKRDGKPMKSKRGQTFRAFLQSLESLGYRIEHRILNAANFGDPTTRERLFIMGRRDRQPIRWPDPSHFRSAAVGQKSWRSAREIIDWDIKGNSIFRRSKPLSPNTLRRIAVGLKKFGGSGADPFLIMLYGQSNARGIDQPVPTVTAGARKIGLCEPFLVKYHGSHSGREDGDQRVKSVDEPVPTLDTSNRLGVVEPFLIATDHTGSNSDLTSGIGQPISTVTSKQRHALVQPFLVTVNHGEGDNRRVRSLDEPMPTCTTRNGMAICEPFVLGQQSGGVARSVLDPIPTVATAGAIALVQPFIVKYYASGTAVSVDQPLDTVTTRDRFMLVEPKTGKAVAELDILFRMLQPHELAAAQGFPSDFRFTGTREDQVKQIGNAVPVGLSTALCRALLEGGSAVAPGMIRKGDL